MSPQDLESAPRWQAALIDDWFVKEVLPLEAALMRLLRRHWRRTDEHADLRQEVYARAYESALRNGPPASASAFVFTCARNLIIDLARHGQVVAIETVAEIESLPEIPGSDFGPERLASARSELKLLSTALEQLPARCREVVALRKVEGLSQREIAERLGIAEGTVEKQVSLGIRALAEALQPHGIEPASRWLMQRARKRDLDS